MRTVLLPACALLALLGARSSAQGTLESPCADTLRELATLLDTAFEHRDADAYLSRFELVHRSVRQTLTSRIQSVLGPRTRWSRESTLTRAWELGGHAIGLVTSRTRNLDHAELGPVDEHAIWAVRGDGPAARIILAIEVDAEHLQMIPESPDPTLPKRLFRCRACNYSIDAGEGWLMVPNCKARIGCLESLSFYSLEHDVAADLSIHLSDGPAMPPPERMLAGLLQAGFGLSPESVQIQDWLPPIYTAATRPMYLDGARCVVDLADEHAEIHLATYGRIGYLMVVRGPRDRVDANRAEAAGLMQSFALQDPALEPEQVVLRITQERQGGLLEGGVYSNARYRVRFAGPPGFSPRMAASSYAFEVRWGRPDGAVTVHLKALEPPAGMDHWTEAGADGVVRSACDRGELEIVTDSGWGTGADGFPRERRLRADRVRDGARESIAIRLGLADDLLVVVEARAVALSAAALRGLTEGLRRTD